MRINYVLLALLACLLIAPAQAEIPEYINIQGVFLKDGAPVAAGDYALRVRIYDGATVGNLLWTSPNALVAIDDKGFFSKRVGGNNLNSPNQPLSQLSFDKPYYVEVSILNATYTQTLATLTPRQPLSAAPYAITAKNHHGGYINMETDVVNLSGTLTIVDNWNIRTVEVPKKNMLAGWIILDNVDVLWGTGYNAKSSWFQLKINNDNVKTDSIVLITPKTDEKAVLTEVGNGYFKVKVTNNNAVISYVIVNSVNPVSAVPPPFNHAPQAENVSFLVAPSSFVGKKNQWVQIGELDGYDYENNANVDYYMNDGTTGDQAGTTGYNWTMRLTGKSVEYMIKSTSWYDAITKLPTNSEMNLFDASGTSPDEHRWYYCQDKGLNGEDVKKSPSADLYASVGNKPLYPPSGWGEETTGPWPPIPPHEPDWGFNEMLNWQQEVVNPVIDALGNPLTEATNPLLSGINNAFASKTTLTQYALKTEVAGLALADNSVTSPKLAANSVTSDKIVDGAISNADIATGAGISTGKISGLVSAITGNGLKSLAYKDAVSDADISGLSASKVSGQFTDSQISGVSASKVSGQLVSSQLADGAISGAKLAAGAIAGASAFKTVASVAALPASIGSGALAFVNSGVLGETGMYMDMQGGSWHKISAFRAPLGDMDGTLPTSKISGLGTLATKNAVDYNSADIANKPALGSLAYKSSLMATDIPALDASKITSGTLSTTAIPNLDASKITTGTISLSKVTFSNSTENLSNWMEYQAARSILFMGMTLNFPAMLKFKQGSTFNGNVYPAVTSTDDTTGYYLGTSSLKWRRVYAWKYYGTNTAITAGDLNEKHNVSGAAEDGDVMMIAGSDQMAVCNVANSTKVAGVYRGTEGGLTMNEELKDGKPIVYTGRYDVKVDATSGAIEPGDLLVSSANPGYAMKAPANPQAGTIIGKALKGMTAGQKGKLLVLVTLQ